MSAQCAALTVPDTAWDFCPNQGANWLFVAIFGLTTIAHIVQMFLHKKAYSAVIITSGVLQTTAYIVRGLSILDPALGMVEILWFLFMMIAPIWTNAYAYMIVGRMIYNFTPTASVFKIKAWRFSLIFVSLDVVAFFIQTAGAAVAVSLDGPMKATGIGIYMDGIGFQQACILGFLFLAWKLHQDMMLLPPSKERKQSIRLIFVQYAVVTLITARIIFRLIEYAQGLESSVPKQEVYQYIFDSTIMWIALVLYNVMHPGRLMPGREADLPTRKYRRGLAKTGQMPRGRLDDNYFLPEYQSCQVSRASSPA